VQFPIVKGANLLRRKVALPADLEGELNILLIAFQRWQQSVIDTWLPFVRQLEETNEGLSYYELPVIQRMNVLARTFINEGMRAGIPDLLARERTVTLYVDKVAFRQALELPHEDDIYIVLVDREGNVLWKEEGAFTSAKGASLGEAIRTNREAN
jgi:hypothetical protein